MTNQQKNRIFFIISWLAICCFYILTSCAEDTMTRLKVKPHAFGKANHLVVIADKDLWEGEVGDTFRYYFSSAFLILPQPEPVLDLKHFTPEDLLTDPIRKELRTYILLANMEDANSPTANLMKENITSERVLAAKEEKGFGTLQKKDKWAQGQMVLFMFGTDKNSLLQNIRTSYPSITKKIQDGDRKLLEANIYGGGENRTLSLEVQQKIGLTIRMPNEYFMTVDEPNFLWLRRETQEMSSNILIHKLPYRDTTQLSYEGFKNLRDSLGKKYISSTIEGSYMQINDTSLPMFVTPSQINGLYAIEARGLWELTKDYMGGPFVSYLIHQPATNELYLVDGFLFAPGKEKRDYMQFLEYIFSTITF